MDKCVVMSWQVSNISGADEALNGDIWMVLSSESIRRSVQPICLRWLEEELSLENKKQDKVSWGKNCIYCFVFSATSC